MNLFQANKLIDVPVTQLTLFHEHGPKHLLLQKMNKLIQVCLMFTFHNIFSSVTVTQCKHELFLDRES